jgi:hypothetical protein
MNVSLGNCHRLEKKGVINLTHLIRASVTSIFFSSPLVTKNLQEVATLVGNLGKCFFRFSQYIKLEERLCGEDGKPLYQYSF